MRKRTAFESSSQKPFRNFFGVLFVHKSLDGCASIFGLAFGLAPEFFRGR